MVFSGGSCFARLIAIRYIATILELPAFWSENYQIQKITMDTLCKQTLLFIEDINPDSVSADDFEAVLFDPDGIDALADAILVGGKHWLQRQPELTESGPPYWLASFVKLVKILRGYDLLFQTCGSALMLSQFNLTQLTANGTSASCRRLGSIVEGCRA